MQTLAPARLRFRTLARTSPPVTAALTLALAGMLFAGEAAAQTATAPYLSMPPLAAYRTHSRDEEAALARTAAPASISAQAKVLVLGDRGYETAAEGANGFVCIVQRGWANEFGKPEFWNPKTRAPICFNPTSARTVLSTYLLRTEWVLAGKSVPEMQAMTAEALKDGRIVPPAYGAMCYMMSKLGYLGDEDNGPWRPHLMFYVPQGEAAEWGANLDGVPLIGGPSEVEPFSIFLLPVEKWSDGSTYQRAQPVEHQHGGQG